MKINNNDYNVMRDAMRDKLKELIDNGVVKDKDAYVAYYINKNIGRDHVKRASWDLFNNSNVNGTPSYNFICRTLYPQGVNDRHIDTTLRRILNEL